MFEFLKLIIDEDTSFEILNLLPSTGPNTNKDKAMKYLFNMLEPMISRSRKSLVDKFKEFFIKG